MAVITPEIKEFIKNNLGWITTVSKDGELDLGPKMSLFVLDDTHIAYHERTAGQHYENLKNGSPLVIAFANLEKKQGYRFRGNVVLHVDDDIYNEQVKVAEEKGTKKPAVIPVLEVTEIQDLASQLVGLAAAPKPGETWWDACAGEGGKIGRAAHPGGKQDRRRAVI